MIEDEFGIRLDIKTVPLVIPKWVVNHYEKYDYRLSFKSDTYIESVKDPFFSEETEEFHDWREDNAELELAYLLGKIFGKEFVKVE